MDNNFEIKKGYNGFIIEKDSVSFSIEKGADGDIWFDSSKGLELPISYYSNNQDEWKSYIVFENLMKTIIGRYILSGDYKDEYAILPKDFIDLDRKIITWHSDSEEDNVLKLKHDEEKIIVSIIKDERVKDGSVRIRIRTNGSDYGQYYKEFEKFYDELTSLNYQVEKIPQKEETYSKKLSIFNKFKR